MAREGQIKFWRKNHIDLDRPNPVLSVTDNVAVNDGAASLPLMRNRNNNSGWRTTESDDSANTELLIETGDIIPIDDIIIVKHNLKNFLIEWWDGGAYQEYFNIVDNEEETTIHTKSVETNRIRITIYGTMIADSDKVISQLIFGEKFGTGKFEGWPIIKRATASSNRRKNKLLSGKINVVEKRGFFSCQLTTTFWAIDNDLTIVEDMYFWREGLLMMLSGGDEDQFRFKRIGYRNEDIVLVRPTNELMNEFVQGVYGNGLKFKLALEEVVF